MIKNITDDAMFQNDNDDGNRDARAAMKREWIWKKFVLLERRVMARHLNLTSILDVLHKRRILFNFLLLFLLSAACAFIENLLPST